jgi:hypothetical protein
MQTAVQVICESGSSLRTQVADRIRSLEADCEFKLGAEKTKGRNPGWLKITSREKGVWGALNISWDTETRTLTCRVVNKRLGTPHRIVGRFVDFLWEHHADQIKLINIFQL